jgi:hypothetical protein
MLLFALCLAVPISALTKRYPGMYLVGYAAGSNRSSVRLYLSKTQDAGIWAATVAAAAAAAAAATGGNRRKQQLQQAPVRQVVRVVAPMRKGLCRIRGSRLVPAAAAVAVETDDTAEAAEAGDMLVEQLAPAAVADAGVVTVTPAVPIEQLQQQQQQERERSTHAAVAKAGGDTAAQPMQIQLQQEQQQEPPEGDQLSQEHSTASPAATAAAAAVRDSINRRSSGSKRKLKLKPPQQLKRAATSTAATAAVPGATSSTAAAAASVPLSVIWEACGNASLRMLMSAAEAAGGPAAVPEVLKPQPCRFKFRRARKVTRLPRFSPQAAAAAAAPAAAVAGGEVLRQAAAVQAADPAAAEAAANEPAKLQIAAVLSFPSVQLSELQGDDLLHDLAAVNASLLQLAEAMQLPDEVLLLLPALLVKATAAAAAEEAAQCGKQQQQREQHDVPVSLHARLQAWHAQLAAAAAAADRGAVIALVKVLSGQLLSL